MNAGSKYDLVLMDIIMPNLDGVSACHLIRQFDNTPIIAMTSNIRSDDISMYFQHGKFCFESVMILFANKLRHERCSSKTVHKGRLVAHAGKTPCASEEAYWAHGWRYGSPATLSFDTPGLERGRIASQVAGNRKLELTQRCAGSLPRWHRYVR